MMKRSKTMLSRKIAASTAALVVVIVPIVVAGYLQQQQLNSDITQAVGQSQGSITNDNNHQAQQTEILVLPNSQVRIECKLPQNQPSKSVSFLWNFDRTVGFGSAKHNVLCFETKCPEAQSFGYQLDMEREQGAYDLMFQNVTYELNDGLYYCKYKDSSPDTKQSIDREFRLTVLMAPQPPVIAPASQAPAREGQEFHLSCATSGGNPEPNISWFRNEQPIGLAGSNQQQAAAQLLGMKIEQVRANETTTSTLSWIPTIEDHKSVFKCVVWNKAMGQMQSYERELRLEVEYSPRINVGPFNPLKVLQGSQATLSCQVDANPPVKGIRWFRDGHLIGNQFNHTIGEIKTSDAALYLCQADNGIAPPIGSLHHIASQATGSGGSSGGGFLSLFGLNADSASSGGRTAAEAQLQLQVLYAPRVQVRPSKAAQALNEGDYFALNCSADAWPPAHEFLWTKQEDPSFRRLAAASSSTSGGGSSYLEFAAIAASDMGNYSCTAINRMEPSLPVQSSADSSAVIERQSSASALVVVRHKPGQAEISLGQGGEVELGAKSQIQCRARPPGYPEPQYQFWRYKPSSAQGGGSGQTGSGHQQKLYLTKQAAPAYNILGATPADEGKYGCWAFNELGHSSEAHGDLVVNEPPTIIQDSARRDEDERLPGDHPYSITVRASGKPEPKVSWFKRSPIDGRRMELNWAEMRSRFRIETISKPDPQSSQLRPKFNVVSTLTFKSPLGVDDRGLYSVEFNNGLSRPAVEDFQLHIHHAPIPAPKNQPLIAAATSGGRDQAAGSEQQAAGQPGGFRIKAGFDVGETVNLTCRVSAFPSPQFLWFGPGAVESDKPIENNPRYRAVQVNTHDDIWESTLSFSNAQEPDYGDYLCVTANHDQKNNRLSDSLQMVITLGRKSIPDPPSQLEPVDATQDSVTLQWVPGFDGGFAHNQYLVQYAPDDGSGLPLLSRRYPQLADAQGVAVMPGNSQQEAAAATGSSSDSGYPKLYDCLNMNPCTINHLLPRQAYVFRARARNELGVGDFSEEVRASTRANISQIPRIMGASFDKSHSILHFRLEPGSDYLLNQLNARIETRSSSSHHQAADGSGNSLLLPVGEQHDEWRMAGPMHPLRQERMEVQLLAMQPVEQVDQIRITLCARSNDSLCGPEFVTGLELASSSYLQDQRSFGYLSALVSSLALIVVLAAFATSVHSCCLSRKGNKKVDSIERADGTIDNKPVGNGGVKLNGSNGQQVNEGSVSVGVNGVKGSHSVHGSTTSTNSTSAGAGTGTGSGGLQSMDSINGAGVLVGAGGSSDHSSNHSRQAKMDSMLPPNYNHYADRASLMLEQQQLMQQQQGLMGSEKLGSPFGNLQSGPLLSVASMNNGYYGHHQPLDHQSMQHHSLSMMDPATGSLMMTSGLEQADGQQQQQQQQLWSTNPMDDYNSYNALSGAADYATSGGQMIDPTYGTTTQQTAQGVNSTANGASYATADQQQASGQYHSSYLAAYQPEQVDQYQQQQQNRVQYQQELAAAQQQMYGTLTRANYSGLNTGSSNNNHDLSATQNNANNQQLIEQQQQQFIDHQQYSTAAGATNGLMPPPPLPPPSQQQQQQQESDYGTTGARGRLIREIIV